MIDKVNFKNDVKYNRKLKIKRAFIKFILIGALMISIALIYYFK